MSNVDVFQEPDDRWRWEFRDGKVDLKSNRTYGDEGSARLAAQTAYPDLFGNSRERTALDSRGFIGKLAKLLTFILVFAVWRRRRSTSF